MTDKISYTLQKPIKVQSTLNGNNEFIDIETIYLQAPSFKQKDKTLLLKKKFIEAVFSMTLSLPKQEVQEQVGNGNLDAKSIKAILFGAKDFDIVSYHMRFESLLTNVAFKDEDMKQSLNLLDLQKLDENDFEELMAKYLEIFFIASWMKTLS